MPPRNCPAALGADACRRHHRTCAQPAGAAHCLKEFPASYRTSLGNFLERVFTACKLPMTRVSIDYRASMTT